MLRFPIDFGIHFCQVNITEVVAFAIQGLLYSHFRDIQGSQLYHVVNYPLTAAVLRFVLY